MMRLFIFCLLSITFWSLAVAQGADTTRHGPILLHALYLEGGGAGGYYSGNYELTLQLRKKRWGFCGSGGFSYYKNKRLYDNFFKTYPIHAGILYSLNDIKLELGFTFCLMKDFYPYPRIPGAYVKDRYLPSFFNVGVRYQKNNNGLYVKANFYPIININSPTEDFLYMLNFYMLNFKRYYWDERSFLPWYGVSIGYSFKAPAERHRKQKGNNKP